MRSGPAAFILVLFSGTEARPQELKDKIESVGAPMGDQWKEAGNKNLYARNVWDLQAFQGRLYASYGDMSLNSGHMAITCYDPQQKKFIKEHATTDQGIFRYRIIGDQLIGAGMDPDGETCSVFLRDKDGWREIHTPISKHAFDACIMGGKLFATIHEGGGRVAESPDLGKTWPQIHGPLDPIRTFSLFELGGQLYVSSFDGSVFRYTGKSFASASGFRTKVAAKDLPAGRNWGQYFVVHKPVNLSRDQIYYIGWNITVDLQAKLSHFNGFGLFLSSAQGSGVSTQPIAVRGLPEDVIVSEGTAYSVANEEIKGEKPYAIRVTSHKGAGSRELIFFKSDALARSIEILDGTLYVGLGCTREALSTSAGEILRIDLKSLKK